MNKKNSSSLNLKLIIWTNNAGKFYFTIIINNDCIQLKRGINVNDDKFLLIELRILYGFCIFKVCN